MIRPWPHSAVNMNLVIIKYKKSVSLNNNKKKKLEEEEGK